MYNIYINNCDPTIFIIKTMDKTTLDQNAGQRQLNSKYDKDYALNSPDKRGYRIGTYEYPNGLRQAEDLQHYVAFYINVRDKSTGGKTNPDNINNFIGNDSNKQIAEAGVKEQLNENLRSADSARISENDAKAAVTTGLNNAGKIAAVGTIIGGVGLGSKLRDIPGLTVKALAAGVIARTAVRMLEKLNLKDFRPGTTSRLKEVITLHVEEKPSVKYGTNYTDKDMGALTGLLVQGSAAAAAGNLNKVAPEIQARFISELIKLPALGSGGGVLNDLRELSTRQKTNPFREVLFESVDYRTFNFRYRFYPKNQDETNKIQKIIEMFKIHMHPEITPSKLFYIYPSEFDIQYFYKDRANPYVHNFARCALTDMSVDYGGEQFNTFRNGAPTEIGLTLTFRELQQLDSEAIKNYGY